MNKPEQFRFREQDRIGYNAADNDRSFLEDCFVDTGDIKTLTDFSDPRCIIMGRAGAGKSALLMQIPESEERVIDIDPHSLAFHHLSTSTIIKFVMDLGADLDVFFKLLWRHVFVIELLRKRFGVKDDKTRNLMLENLRNAVRSPEHKQAIQYIDAYSGAFLDTTDTRVVERSQELETTLHDQINAKIKEFGFQSSSGEKFTEKQKMEMKQGAQSVINHEPIQDLTRVIAMLEAVLSRDPQKRYYIIIDGLDENWIEDTVRYRLIRSLIDTIAFMNKKLSQVKIIITMRVDLLDRVYELTKDPGFQREKYRDLEFHLSWQRERLIEMVDKRITRMIRSQYSSSKEVTHDDILPANIGNRATIDYMLNRTLMRPRDMIDFFNESINQATNSPIITEDMLQRGEADYSSSRLQSLADEWRADYPYIATFVLGLLKNKTGSFSIHQIADAPVWEFCYSFALGEGVDQSDFLSRQAYQLANGTIEADEFKASLMSVFYKIGIVGLKTESMEKINWAYINRPTIPSSQISHKASVSIHPCLWRVLSIRNKE